MYFFSDTNKNVLLEASKKMLYHRLPEKVIPENELRHILTDVMKTFSTEKDTDDNIKALNKKTLLNVLNHFVSNNNPKSEDDLEVDLMRFEKSRNSKIANIDDFIENSDLSNDIANITPNINITLPKQDQFKEYFKTYIISSSNRNWEKDNKRSHFTFTHPINSTKCFFKRIAFSDNLLKFLKKYNVIKINFMNKNGKIFSFHCFPSHKSNVWKTIENTEPIIIDKFEWTVLILDEFDEPVNIGEDNLKIINIDKVNVNEYVCNYVNKSFEPNDLLIKTKNGVEKFYVNGLNRYKTNYTNFDTNDAYTCLELNNQFSIIFAYAV